jgi:hypothetical protein
VAIPGAVEADLVLVESGLAFRGLEAFFDRPSCARYADQFSGWLVPGVVASVIGEFSGIGIAPDHVLDVRFAAADDEGPVVNAESLCSDAARTALPGASFGQV